MMGNVKHVCACLCGIFTLSAFFSHACFNVVDFWYEWAEKNRRKIERVCVYQSVACKPVCERIHLSKKKHPKHSQTLQKKTNKFMHENKLRAQTERREKKPNYDYLRKRKPIFLFISFVCFCIYFINNTLRSHS